MLHFGNVLGRVVLGPCVCVCPTYKLNITNQYSVAHHEHEILKILPYLPLQGSCNKQAYKQKVQYSVQ